MKKLLEVSLRCNSISCLFSKLLSLLYIPEHFQNTLAIYQSGLALACHGLRLYLAGEGREFAVLRGVITITIAMTIGLKLERTAQLKYIECLGYIH